MAIVSCGVKGLAATWNSTLAHNQYFYFFGGIFKDNLLLLDGRISWWYF